MTLLDEDDADDDASSSQSGYETPAVSFKTSLNFYSRRSVRIMLLMYSATHFHRPCCRHGPEIGVDDESIVDCRSVLLRR